MPCYEYRSDFIDANKPNLKPYRFGSYPLMLTRVDYEAQRLERVDVTSEVPYTQLQKCTYPIELHWLNRKGGWDSFTFNFKHTYSINTSNGKTFVTGNSEEFYATRGIVSEGVNVVSEYLDKEGYLALCNILHSLSVWEFKNGKWLGVRVAEGSYRTHQEGDKLFSLAFDFTYSKTLKVQLA